MENVSTFSKLVSDHGLSIVMLGVCIFTIGILWWYYTRELKEQSKRHREEVKELIEKNEVLHNAKTEIAIKCIDTVRLLTDAHKKQE